MIQSHLLWGSHSVLPFTEAESIGLTHVKELCISAQLRNSSAEMVVGFLRIPGDSHWSGGLGRSPPAHHAGSSDSVYRSTGPANPDLLLCFLECFWEILLPPALFSLYDLAEVLLS